MVNSQSMECPPGFGGLVVVQNINEKQGKSGETSDNRTVADLGADGFEIVGRCQVTITTVVGEKAVDNIGRQGVQTQNTFEPLVSRKECWEKMDEGSKTGPSRVVESIEAESPLESVDRVESSSGSLVDRNRARSKSRERNKLKGKQTGPRYNGLMVPTLVLSKRNEWEAHGRSVIKNKLERAKEKEKNTPITERSMENENGMMEKQGRTQQKLTLREANSTGRNGNTITMIVRESSRSDVTPTVRFNEESGSEGVSTYGEDNLNWISNSNELVSGLANCKSEEDITIWWKHMVIPTARKMGLSFNLGEAMLHKFLKKLCLQHLGRIEGRELERGRVEETRKLSVLEGEDVVFR
ncbi:hypothetical protein FRX31_024989 [Thalictrum thalictroides]|uniref:Uncharacterized protein n=1 Tax=Thalictrum thalictroides TaxID=46969 RepID=A0A7J6VK03_THATH|nr:hypothetical protein FRX31_024989 [Thalictrum thalictroides]